MKSIFDLKTSKDQLSSTNSGMAEVRYRQVLPLRNVVDNEPAENQAGQPVPLVQNFGNGVISLRWALDESTWFIPRDCYISMRVRVGRYKGDDQAHLTVQGITMADNISLPFGVIPNLINKMQIKCNNKTIESIDENIPQVESLCVRQKMSGQWQRNFGNAANYWHPDYNQRAKYLASDGYNNNIDISNVTDNDVYTRVETFAGSGLVAENAAWAAVAKTFTWVAGPDLTAAPLLKVGNYILIQSALNANIQHISRIVTVVGLVLTVDSAYNNANVAANVANNALFNIRAIKPAGRANLINPSRGVQEFELIWKPLSLGFLNVDHAICGSNARWEFEITPFNKYEKRALESPYGTNVDVNTGAINSYLFQVKDFKFYIKTCRGPKIEKLEYYIDMNKVKCHTQSLTNNGATTQTTIDIQPSSYALTWALQDARVGSHPGYSSSLFIHNNGQQRSLKRYSLRISNFSAPNPDADYNYIEGGDLVDGNPVKGTDYMVEPYIRNSMYDGSYFDSTHESLIEWRDKLGQYFHHLFLRSGTDKEARCYLLTNFDGQLTETPRILLFEHYKAVALIKIENSTVIDVAASNS
jgi:hypothetical protein